MARLFTCPDLSSFDQRAFDLRHILNAPLETSYRPGTMLMGNPSYRDVFFTCWKDDGAMMAGGFAGPQITVSNGHMTGGTVTTFSQLQVIKGTATPLWEMTGLFIEARDLDRAARSPSLDDDRAVIAQLLSGPDQIRLTPGP
ncbi:hypothetical protein [Paracoccus sp. (in: a-proteobacteria)]|uniref:hypothetical protein n=1 Tax=Paracoccus sp. TaxID=267 RepID=UPI0026E06789|nr:hypothetical protein [Paracoccus sp. (in: a-proteobacteria)]MDO5647596.1 hypothetical protein [Paracoccus sp. (in: a-proteobacteria)]